MMRTVFAEFTVEDLVRTVVGTVTQEYPHKLDQELNSDGDLKPPRELNPTFYGCYDWHSAVHSHWLLVRCLASSLSSELRKAVVELLTVHLSEERIGQEVKFFGSPGGRTSERPYGWAWLLLLHAECARSSEMAANQWTKALNPLAALLRGRLMDYLSGLAPYPIRSGTHANTALALQLTLEASRLVHDADTERSVTSLALQFFGDSAPATWGAVPSGTDFLSAPLTEGALMAEAMTPDEFGGWLSQAVSDSPGDVWRAPLVAADDANFGGAHLEGLLVTRAWSMAIVARALGADHPHSPKLALGLAEHLDRVRQIQPAAGFHRAHWLPTFLVYLEDQLSGGVDRRGIASGRR